MNFKFKINIILLLSFSCLNWIYPTLTSWAEASSHLTAEEITFIPAKNRQEPPKRGTPETEEGTGSRGNCPYNENLPPLTSLVGDKDLTLTVNRHPSFWIYIPYETSQVAAGEFVIQDEQQDLYRTQVSLPANIPGIVEISLPITSKSLELNKEYRWYFEMDCSQQTKNSEPEITSFATLTGIVRLITPKDELNQSLHEAQTPLEKASVFAEHGIWHDTLDELIQFRSQDADGSKFEQLWQHLLGQANVAKTEIANQPFVGKARIVIK